MAREGMGLTQEDVARRAGITPKFLSQIENGHSNPSIAVVERLVEDGLMMTLSEFFSDGVTPRDDVAKIRVALAGQSAAVRRQALAIVKALVRASAS